MIEVNTKDELNKALFAGEADTIQVGDARLTIGLMTRPRKFRRVRYLMFSNGYRMVALHRLGAFSAMFVKDIAAAGRQLS